MWFSIVSLAVITLCLNCSIGEALSGIEKAILDRHNYYRKLHGVPPLKYSPKISKFSRKWANSQLGHDELKHSLDETYGENIWGVWSTDKKYTMVSKQPVDDWYGEIKYYKNYKKEPSVTGVGHFTQLIWRGSREVGIGIAKKITKNSSQYVVVCNYYPPGNYRRQYTKNVLPPKSRG